MSADELVQPPGGGGGRNGGVGGGDGNGAHRASRPHPVAAGGCEGDPHRASRPQPVSAGAVELTGDGDGGDGEGAVNVGAEVTVIPRKELAAEVEPSVVARAFVMPEAVEPTGTAMTAVMITEPAATWTTTKDGGT